MITFWTQERIARNAAGEPAGGAATPDPEPAAAATTTPEPETSAGDPAPGQAPQADTYDWMPESYRADGQPDFQRFRQDFDDAQAQLAALNENAPESPDAYDFAMPDGIDYGEITPPEWFDFQIDPDDPAIGELRGVLHKHRVPASAAQELMQTLARSEAAKAARFHEQAQQELNSLGPQQQARMQRVQRAIETRVPNQAQRDALLNSLTTADAFRALESFVSGATKTTSSTAPGNSQLDSITDPFERLKAIREAG